MAATKKRAPLDGALNPGTLLAIRGLSGAAILLAGYLAWISFTNMNAVGCGPESGCQEVLNSKWAYFLGVPVSLLGLLAYAVLFAASFQLAPATQAAKQRAFWRLLLPAAVLAAGGALWFTGVQLFIIKRFCPYCMTTHALAFLAGVIVLIKAPIHAAPDKPWQQDKQIFLPPRLGLQLGLAALIALAVLGIGQNLSTKKTFVEKSMDQAPQIDAAASASSTNAIPADHTASSTVPEESAAPRLMQLFDGAISMDLTQVPLYGKTDAPHVMVSMHDYTCKHCRTAHGPLLDLHRQFSNELAIVSLPMPLDATCNRLVPRTPTDHTNACQYATLGLAVWRANRQAFEFFENFVFGPPRPPSLEQTRTFAVSLVGETALNQAMADPWVADQLRTSTGIYMANFQKYRQSSMPQFIIGTNVVFGFPEREFLNRVTNQFGLILPQPKG